MNETLIWFAPLDKSSQKKEKKLRLDVGFGVGLGEYSSAIIFGIASGILNAGRTIRDRFLDDIKNSKDIVGKTITRNAETLGNIPMSKEGAVDGVPTRTAAKEYAAIIRDTKKKQAEVVDDLILKTRGVRKSMFLGTLDRAGHLGKRSVNAIIGSAIIGAVVGIVLTLGFFNGMATRNKIQRIDDAVEPELETLEAQEARTTRHVDRLAAANDKYKTTTHVDKLAATHDSAKDKTVAAAR